MVDINKLSSNGEINTEMRPNLEKISYDGNFGRARTRALYDMLYRNGPGSGTMLSLPFDQLVEHGIGHSVGFDGVADPRKVIELANKGVFSALALSIGQAEKYQNLIKSSLPLIVKVDGHLLVGEEVNYPRHSTMSSVERAVEAGADAIGFTFYIGEKETEQDMERVAPVVEKSHRLGKPVFMWAYARGPLVNKMGADSLYWCSQGISVAESLGVDVVKQKFPMPAKNIEEYRKNLAKDGYLGKNMSNAEQLLELEPMVKEGFTYDLMVKRLSFASQIAPNLIKIVSGGPKGDREKLLQGISAVMDGGFEGVIVGRNLWARQMDEALKLNDDIVKVMQRPAYVRKLKEERI